MLAQYCKQDAKEGQWKGTLSPRVIDVVLKVGEAAVETCYDEKNCKVVVDANFVFCILIHLLDPEARCNHVHKEHHEIKSHQWILVGVKEAKAIQEGDLTLDQ